MTNSAHDRNVGGRPRRFVGDIYQGVLVYAEKRLPVGFLSNCRVSYDDFFLNLFVNIIFILKKSLALINKKEIIADFVITHVTCENITEI